MGTRSTIAIRNTDGTFNAIYCHWDGYLEHNGRILAENYTTEAAVRELIALGDLSSLGETVGVKTDFNNAADGQCVAYGRDRGETGIEAGTYVSFEDLQDKASQEYTYVYDAADNTWSVAFGSRTNTQPLVEALAKETA